MAVLKLVAIGIAVLLPALAGAQEVEEPAPRYPLGRLRLPYLTQPGEPLFLSDFRYRLADSSRSTLQSFALRFKLKDSLFLGGEAGDGRRRLLLQTPRIDLDFAEQERSYRLAAGYRGSRFLLRLEGLQRSEELGDGLLLAGESALRLNGDLEILLGYLQETGGSPSLLLPTRPSRQGSIGFLYQVGNALEAAARVSHGRKITPAGEEMNAQGAAARVLLHRSRVQLESRASYEARSGRLGGEEGSVGVSADVELTRHWVVHGASDHRWEPGLKRFADEIRGGVSFFGKRHRFARGGLAAERMLQLTRLAHAVGYHERRVYDLDGLRSLRERLALSGHRNELSEAIEALYRAQVQERNVPQLGFEIAHHADDLEGSSGWMYRGFFGIPWPLEWPLGRSEDRVPFVALDLIYGSQTFRSGHRADARALVLEVALHRELSLFLRWQDADRTPEQIARRAGSQARFEIDCVYAFGR